MGARPDTLPNKPDEHVNSFLTGVGVGDLIGLVGVQPNLLLATAQDAGGKPLLEPEHAGGHKNGVSPFNLTQTKLQ